MRYKEYKIVAMTGYERFSVAASVPMSLVVDTYFL